MSSGPGRSAGDPDAAEDPSSHHHRAQFTLLPAADRAQRAEELSERLVALVGVVPELSFVRAVASSTPDGADVFLHAVYPSTEAMARVRAHPAHVAVIEWYRTVADDDRRVELDVPPADGVR